MKRRSEQDCPAVVDEYRLYKYRTDEYRLDENCLDENCPELRF